MGQNFKTSYYLASLLQRLTAINDMKVAYIIIVHTRRSGENLWHLWSFKFVPLHHDAGKNCRL